MVTKNNLDFQIQILETTLSIWVSKYLESKTLNLDTQTYVFEYGNANLCYCQSSPLCSSNDSARIAPKQWALQLVKFPINLSIGEGISWPHWRDHSADPYRKGGKGRVGPIPTHEAPQENGVRGDKKQGTESKPKDTEKLSSA